MQPKNINEVLTKFQTLILEDKKDDLNWEFYFELILNQYSKLIYKLIGNRQSKHDYFNECVCFIPSIVESWDINKGMFSTHLTTRLRGVIQKYNNKDRNIPIASIHQLNSEHKKNGKEKIEHKIMVSGDLIKKGTEPTQLSSALYNDMFYKLKSIPHFDIWHLIKVEGYSIREISKIKKKSPSALYIQLNRCDDLIKKRTTRLFPQN